MQFIQKSDDAPDDFITWKAKNTSATWDNLTTEIKASLRTKLRAEQKGLCCYCCKSLNDCHIEHLHSRDQFPRRCFDYANFLISCNTSKQCGNAKSNKSLDLHPLMTECDTEISLNLAGELITNTKRATQAIELLNINNRQLTNYRKARLDMIRFTFDSAKPTTPVQIIDEKTLNMLLDSLDETTRAEFEYLLAKLRNI